jgi:hypothetical protein
LSLNYFLIGKIIPICPLEKWMRHPLHYPIKISIQFARILGFGIKANPCLDVMGVGWLQWLFNTFLFHLHSSAMKASSLSSIMPSFIKSSEPLSLNIKALSSIHHLSHKLKIFRYSLLVITLFHIVLEVELQIQKFMRVCCMHKEDRCNK